MSSDKSGKAARKCQRPAGPVSGTAGYTLLELMVVMILITLAGSMVFVNLGNSMGKRKNKAFAEQLYGLLSAARQTAVLQRQPVAVKISASESLCWMDPGQGRAPLKVPEQIQIDGADVARVDEDVHALYFYPDGSASGGILYLSTDGVVLTGLRVDRLLGVISKVTDKP